LQNNLGCPQTTLAFDVNLGCSGFVYGLYIACSFIQGGSLKRVLLLVGDTQTKLCYSEDKNVVFLLGDAGTATVIEAFPGGPEIKMKFMTDGSRYDKLIVPGGGAPEIRIAQKLGSFAKKQTSKVQLAVQRFAKAMEIIPRTLAENAGLDPIDVLSELYAKHSKEVTSGFGVDPFSGKVKDMAKMNVFEPISVKTQAITSAAEAAEMILRIDDVIASKELSGPSMPEGPGPEDY